MAPTTKYFDCLALFYFFFNHCEWIHLTTTVFLLHRYKNHNVDEPAFQIGMALPVGGDHY